MNSKDYWSKRSELNIQSAEKSADELMSLMQQSYKDANRVIRNEINNFYSRFTYNQQISYEETLKRMNKAELKEFKEQAKEYYEKAYADNWQTAYTDEMRTLSGRAYMSRLEGLKVNIAHQYQQIAEELNIKLGEGLKAEYDKGFEQTMFNVAKDTGIGVDFTRVNNDIVQKTLKEKWHGANYSDDIWANKEKLVSTLNSTLPVLFTLGKSPNECAKVLNEKLDAGYRNAVRLVRTEFNRIANESTADAYAECGIDQYEFLATLDTRTSDLCAELDGKVFKVKDKQVGVNFPPMHPNCRSTTVPYFPEDYNERIAKDKNGKYFYVPSGTTFEDWHTMVYGSPKYRTGEQVVKEVEKNPKTITSYDEIESFLKDDIGFTYVEDNFAKVDKSLAIDSVNQLSKLDARFKAIKKSIANICSVSSGSQTTAYVRSGLTNPLEQSLSLCPKFYGSKSAYEKTIADGMSTGHNMPHKKELDSVYYVTHEYGHMLQNTIIAERYAQDGWTSENPKAFMRLDRKTSSARTKWYDDRTKEVEKQCCKEILDIAKEKNPSFSLKANISTYGKSNYAEFFAEVFANSQLGEPNELGDAMNEWLTRKGY